MSSAIAVDPYFMVRQTPSQVDCLPMLSSVEGAPHMLIHDEDAGDPGITGAARVADKSVLAANLMGDLKSAFFDKLDSLPYNEKAENLVWYGDAEKSTAPYTPLSVAAKV